jgi:hypothetical protein
MDTTTNLELEDLAKKMKINLVGVFSKDQLPKSKSVGGYILNLQDNEDGGGTHWVGFTVSSKGPVLYFDSFGLSPPKEVKTFVKNKVAYNTRHLQDMKSNACGYWVLAFLKKNFSDIEEYDDWVNTFRVTNSQNERWLKTYFKKYNI